MEKEFENAGKWVQKYAKVLLIVAILTLFIGTGSGLIPLETSNYMNPGFEGAKVNTYGVNVLYQGTGWNGTNTLHIIGNEQNGIPLAQGPGQSIGWASSSYASQTLQRILYDGSPVVTGQLATEVESNPILQNFNFNNSSPLAIPGTGDPTLADYIQYWQISNTTTITGNTFTLTKQDFLLVPADFHLTVWIPTGKDSTTGSGWQESGWANMEFWYAIYWYDWLNSLGQVIQNDPNPPQVPTGAVNYNSLFTLRGGFPIAAWIQSYQIPFQTGNGQILDALTVKTSDNPDQQIASLSLDANTLHNVIASVSLDPDLQGRTLPLYTQPSDIYTPISTMYSPSFQSNLTQFGITAAPNANTQPPLQYFKITVTAMSTYTKADGWFGTGPYHVYYPAANYLIRLIMGVYGTHTYVWTVQTATQQGYISPNGTFGWVDRTVQTVTGGSGISFNFDWGSLFSPLNFEFFAILAVIVVLAVTVFNPGVWANIFHKQKD